MNPLNAAPDGVYEHPELDALEAFLAGNPDELNPLLDTPFGDLARAIADLGFDTEVLIEELAAIGLLTEELWIESVQLEQAEFLALTPLQYCEKFPDIGAPLVLSVLNAIKLSDEQSELLSKAGGTNLSRGEKVEIGVGIAGAGVAALYVLPRLYQHVQLKRELVAYFDKDIQNTDSKLKFTAMRYSREEGILYKFSRDSSGATRLSIKADTYAIRLYGELSNTLPVLLWRKIQGAINKKDAPENLAKETESDIKDAAAGSEIEQKTIREEERIERSPYKDLSHIYKDSGPKIKELANAAANKDSQINDSLIQYAESKALDIAAEKLAEEISELNRIEDAEMEAVEKTLHSGENKATSFVDQKVDSLEAQLAEKADQLIDNAIQKEEIAIDNQISEEIDAMESEAESAADR
jgi:hypothetical protein